MNASEFGSIIRAHRKAAGTRQAAAAEAAGISRVFWSQVETGHSTPSWPVANKMVAAVGLRIQLVTEGDAARLVAHASHEAHLVAADLERAARRLREANPHPRDGPMKIYLTNASSRKPPHRGPGRVWTIMALPRRNFGEAGEGDVPSLVPGEDHLRAVRSGDMTLGLYRGIYQKDLRESLDGQHLTHPYLVAQTADGLVSVADGDTLICCCSRAKAAAGECHRAWAAIALKEAGWAVVLDGVEL